MIDYQFPEVVSLGMQVANAIVSLIDKMKYEYDISSPVLPAIISVKGDITGKNKHLVFENDAGTIITLKLVPNTFSNNCSLALQEAQVRYVLGENTHDSTFNTGDLLTLQFKTRFGRLPIANTGNDKIYVAICGKCGDHGNLFITTKTIPPEFQILTEFEFYKGDILERFEAFKLAHAALREKTKTAELVEPLFVEGTPNPFEDDSLPPEVKEILNMLLDIDPELARGQEPIH